jgi:hypothetical protein
MPIQNDAMMIKHLADFEMTTAKQLASGLYNDRTVRRSNLDVEVQLTRKGEGGKTETDSVKANGASWRVGGGLDRTLLVAAKDASGNPVIVVVNRCKTKQQAGVDASYTVPEGTREAIRDLTRPGWDLK